MRLLSLCTLALLLFALPVCADEPTGATPGQPLFDGKTLNGWVAEGVITQPDPNDKTKTQPVWTAEDGVIRCAGKGFGFLRYDEKQFGDFHLHVEYRMLGAGGRNNSGIGIRTTKFDPKRSRDTRPSFASYEIQLLNDAGAAPDDHGTGSLYRYVAPKVNVVKPAPAWNTMDVICTGPRIRIVMNGTEILDYDQSTNPKLRDKPLRGYVCLQNHGTPIEFRNVWVRETGAAGGE